MKWWLSGKDYSGTGTPPTIDVWGFPIQSLALAESGRYNGEVGRNLFQQESHKIEVQGMQMTCWMAGEGAQAGEQVPLLTMEEGYQPLS